MLDADRKARDNKSDVMYGPGYHVQWQNVFDHVESVFNSPPGLDVSLQFDGWVHFDITNPSRVQILYGLDDKVLGTLYDAVPPCGAPPRRAELKGHTHIRAPEKEGLYMIWTYCDIQDGEDQAINRFGDMHGDSFVTAETYPRGFNGWLIVAKPQIDNADTQAPPEEEFDQNEPAPVPQPQGQQRNGGWCECRRRKQFAQE